MAVSRYDNRNIFTNDHEGYKKEFFEDRDVKQINQYDTAIIHYPALDRFQELDSVRLSWGSTDKLYNIAYEYYRDPTYWWVIAWYNRKPTEAHFSPGDIYYVPMPLDKAIDFFHGSRK